MKSAATQQSTNTYGYQQPPQWAGMDAFNQGLQSYDTADPSIPYNFNNQRASLQNRIDNPFGPGFSPEVSDAMKYAGNEQLNQGQGQALREDAFNRRNAKQSALGTAAALTAPQLVQTGGSSRGTQSAPLGPALIGMAGALGGGALA